MATHGLSGDPDMVHVHGGSRDVGRWPEEEWRRHWHGEEGTADVRSSGM